MCNCASNYKKKCQTVWRINISIIILNISRVPINLENYYIVTWISYKNYVKIIDLVVDQYFNNSYFWEPKGTQAHHSPSLYKNVILIVLLRINETLSFFLLQKILNNFQWLTVVTWLIWFVCKQGIAIHMTASCTEP